MYRLYQQLQLIDRDQEQRLEQLLSNFLQEIKVENKQLQSQLNDKPPSPTNKEADTDPVTHYATKNYEDKIVGSSFPIKETKDFFETSGEAEVLHFHQQGLTIEEIAKKLNRGKTEVELIIKLNQN